MLRISRHSPRPPARCCVLATAGRDAGVVRVRSVQRSGGKKRVENVVSTHQVRDALLTYPTGTGTIPLRGFRAAQALAS